METTIERDLNDVAVFVQVAQLGSFTAAGKALGLPTSTVSRRVARLEDALSARLIHRTTRKLNLSDAGHLYFDHCVQALLNLTHAEALLAESQAMPRGRVRIAAPPEHSITASLATAFLKKYTDVRIELELTNRSVDMVEDRYDAAIQVGTLPSSSLVATKLMDSPLRLVASPHYLSRMGEPADPQELSEHDCVLSGTSGTNRAWKLPRGNKTVRVRVTGRLVANHLGAILEAAVNGLGIAILPAITCGHDIRQGRLRVVLPDASPESVPVWIVYQGNRYVGPAVRAFIDFTKENFARIAESSGTDST